MHILYMAAIALGFLALVLVGAVVGGRRRRNARGMGRDGARRYAAGARGGDADGHGEDAP